MPRYTGLPLDSNVVGLKLAKPAAAHTSRTPVVIDHGVQQRFAGRSEKFSLISKLVIGTLTTKHQFFSFGKTGGNATSRYAC